VRVVECELVRTPALHGLVRPVILLPAGLPASFSPTELRHVILHELWHLRRYDVAVSWILSAVQTLHWFNPVVWFAASRIKEERELACDELALYCLEEDERSGYGMTILKLLERFRAPAPIPALVGIVNEKQKMKRRMTMIASFRNRTRFTALLAATVALVGFIGLTDASAGGVHHKVMKDLDPAAMANAERLHERISVDVTDASLADFLSAVSNAAGVVITQSPDLATSDAQKARFTVKAEQVPAHLVLMESLVHFQLAPKPTASGVEIAAGGHRVMVLHGPEHHEKDVIITNGDHAEAEHVIRVLEGEAGEEAMVLAEGEVHAADGKQRVIIRKELKKDGEATEDAEVNERVMVRKISAKEMQPDADGHIRREVKLQLDENGVKSEGKLTIDIVP
jgi:hypothetical protein